MTVSLSQVYAKSEMIYKSNSENESPKETRRYTMGCQFENSSASLHRQCESGTWIWLGTAVFTTLHKLQKIKNAGLRIIRGGKKSTPINEMESLAGLKSLEEQRQEKLVLQAEKYKCLQRHPMHSKMSELSSYCIKRSKFKKTTNAKCQNILTSCHKERMK